MDAPFLHWDHEPLLRTVAEWGPMFHDWTEGEVWKGMMCANIGGHIVEHWQKLTGQVVKIDWKMSCVRWLCIIVINQALEL